MSLTEGSCIEYNAGARRGRRGAVSIQTLLLSCSCFLQELRTELENRGLDSSGLKQALIERLEAALASPAVNKTTPASPAAAPASTADPASKPPATAAVTPCLGSEYQVISWPLPDQLAFAWSAL